MFNLLRNLMSRIRKTSRLFSRNLAEHVGIRLTKTFFTKKERIYNMYIVDGRWPESRMKIYLFRWECIEF